MTRPFFSRDRISDFELFTRHSDIVIAKMAERFREGVAVDFQDAVARFTLDSATEFLFGNCVNSAEAGLPYPENHHLYGSDVSRISTPERFARAFGDAQWDIATRLRTGFVWPLREFSGDRTKKPMEIVNAYLDPILAEALRKKKASQGSGPVYPGEREKKEITEDVTLLDHLVKQTEGKKP